MFSAYDENVVYRNAANRNGLSEFGKTIRYDNDEYGTKFSPRERPKDVDRDGLEQSLGGE